MKSIHIGLIREGKTPPDLRVPLTPKQCKALETIYPHVKVSVQRSPIRTYHDDAYYEEGIALVDDLKHCDIILGVKEVNIADLIPNKTFIFFSHTIKKQPYNRELLRAILDQKIRLIDYEVIRDKNQKRLIGFGRYAGIVGCYNTFLAYGLKSGHYHIKPAHLCKDRKEVESELQNVTLPSNFRVLITGFGRVGHGAKEIMEQLPIKEVSPQEFLSESFNEPIYCQLEAEDYYVNSEGGFVKKEFYENASTYTVKLKPYLDRAEMYIPCHFWDSRSPILVSKDDLLSNQSLVVIGDISCDIAGPIASTMRASKISSPIYGYDRETGNEVDFRKEGCIAVMAVDNLPCELPRDASDDFGSELLKHVFPKLLHEDLDGIIDRASETNFEGQLNPGFEYLQDYVDGLE